MGKEAEKEPFTPMDWAKVVAAIFNDCVLSMRLGNGFLAARVENNKVLVVPVNGEDKAGSPLKSFDFSDESEVKRLRNAYEVVWLEKFREWGWRG